MSGVALGAGDRIPDPDRIVVGGGGQPAAVGGARHRLHGAGVAGEGVALGAGGRVPDPDRVGEVAGLVYRYVKAPTVGRA